MSDPRATPDLLIARIAARQHGVVSIAQIRMAGLDKHQVLHRVRTARLHRIHQGVFAVGHLHLSKEGKWKAATLAGGDAAVLSHRSAASLWELLPNRERSGIEISVPGDGGRRRRAGIRLHRCPSLRAEHVTRRQGIPVTTPSRTVADLRGAVSPPELRRAERQADVLGLPLGSSAGSDGTRSELEYRFLELCRKHRLPTPEVNVRIGSLVVDFLWLGRGLIVETDGYRYHRGRIAFEEDHSRDLRLQTLGYSVIRVTYRQVMDCPGEVAAGLRKALSVDQTSGANADP
jgi:very-short-patch-repair endonuclease